MFVRELIDDDDSGLNRFAPRFRNQSDIEFNVDARCLPGGDLILKVVDVSDRATGTHDGVVDIHVIHPGFQKVSGQQPNGHSRR